MVDTAKLLRFLQAHKFDLAREVPGFMDLYMAKDGSAELVLRVAAPMAHVPFIEFEEEVLPLKVVVDYPDAPLVQKIVVMEGLMKPVEASPSVQQLNHPGVIVVPEKVSLGPHEAGGRDQSAFDAWQKRHSAVKVEK